MSKRTKVIYNKYIPIKGFLAMNVFGTLFVRKNPDGSRPYLSLAVLNHEDIHIQQMKELLYIPFYILYVLEFLIRLCLYMFNFRMAYYNISFEREAFAHEYNHIYLEQRRKPYAWVKYIFHK